MTDKKIEFPGTKPPELPEDKKSLGEALAMATGIDLSNREQLNKLNKLLREDGLERHLSKVLVCGLWVLAIAALIMFATVVLHKIKPDLWLNKDQISDLQGFLFSGSIGAALAAGGKRVFKNDKNA